MDRYFSLNDFYANPVYKEPALKSKSNHCQKVDKTFGKAVELGTYCQFSQ